MSFLFGMSRTDSFLNFICRRSRAPSASLAVVDFFRIGASVLRRKGMRTLFGSVESSCSIVLVDNRSPQLFKGGSYRLHSIKIRVLTFSVSSERVRLILIRIKNDSYSGSREKRRLRLKERRLWPAYVLSTSITAQWIYLAPPVPCSHVEELTYSLCR